LLPDPRLIAQDKYKQLTFDFLLTYLLHPGTALYIGYNNQLQNLALDPTTPPHIRYAVSELNPYGPPDFR